MQARIVLDPEKWVDEHGDILFRYALLRLRDAAAAEEVVQETFVSALKGRDGFRGRSSERSWLVGILKHKIADYFRRISRVPPSESLVGQRPAEEELFDERGRWLAGPRDWGSDPAELVERQQFRQVLAACLQELPLRQMQAFSLRELDGFGREEICKILQISATNFGVLVHRARLRLRSCLEQRWFDRQAEKGQ